MRRIAHRRRKKKSKKRVNTFIVLSAFCFLNALRTWIRGKPFGSLKNVSDYVSYCLSRRNMRLVHRDVKK